ncbi:NAD(P)/FAD-dependent oxidoreductase [Sphingobacterium sp. Mn56C]|uniref:NAD(P)/FAD-dependent oxidoreductase n=1 Tax=Sphingobacterium sp. Mn56C TaxID=3395261 RepID=UPI003BEB3F16
MDLKSNEPFWLVKNGIINSYPSLKENASCEVLIVGGGITGSLVAHQCIQDGYKTILIDKREIANGSSSATTAMLQYEIDTPLYLLRKMIGKGAADASYKACAEAIDLLQEIGKEINSEAGFKKKSSLYFAALKKDVPWLLKEYQARKDAGFMVKWLTADAIHRKFKLSNTHGGILSEQGASVDAFRLVHELLSFNKLYGLQVYDRTELLETKTLKSGVKAVLSSGHEIMAHKIIYCTGYESTNLIKENFVNLISTYALVSEVEKKKNKSLKELLIWNTSAPYMYMRTTDDGRILIGGEDEKFVNPEKRDKLIHKKSKNLRKKFEKYIPEIPFNPDYAWAGTFGETKDGLPYIGTHKKFKHSYFVLGFGGNGITFSVIGMAMISKWLSGKKHNLQRYFRFGR